MKLTRRSRTEHGLAMTLGTVLLLVLLAVGALYLLGLPGDIAAKALPPAMTATSYRPLTVETERALGAIVQARRALHGDLTAAEVDLERAATALRRLRDFYLPLMDARDHAYGSHLVQLRGNPRRAARELGTVEEILLATSARDEQVARSLRLPLSTLIQARSEVASGAPAAAERIEQLGREINLLILKGDLALAGSHLEPR
jgi:hypothetical protein